MISNKVVLDRFPLITALLGVLKRGLWCDPRIAYLLSFWMRFLAPCLLSSWAAYLCGSSPCPSAFHLPLFFVSDLYSSFKNAPTMTISRETCCKRATSLVLTTYIYLHLHNKAPNKEGWDFILWVWRSIIPTLSKSTGNLAASSCYNENCSRSTVLPVITTKKPGWPCIT